MLQEKEYSMDLIYLDYNCFQRRFDDTSQIKIQLEALACEEIFLRAEIEQIQWPGPSCMRTRPYSAPFQIE